MNKQTNRPGLRSTSITVLPAVAVLLVFAAACEAQAQIFPQLTDGGGWRMAIFLENTTATAATASLSFYQDTANGATTPWNPPFVETSNTQNIPIPAGGTYYLSTPGTAATLSQGWGQLTGNGVVGFVVYTLESYAGRPDQDGTSQATAAAGRILVPFDCTTGFATGFAIVNPTSSAETVSVNIETDTGAVTQTQLPSLPSAGQLELVAATQFPSTVGHRGMAEFYVSSGSISIAAFRFNPSLALTSLPVFQETGPPIIASGGSSPFTIFLVGELNFQPAGFPLGLLAPVFTPNADGTWSVLAGGPVLTNGTFSNGGLAFSANVLAPSTVPPPYGVFGVTFINSSYLVSSESLSFTLTPTLNIGRLQEGNLSGTLTVTGTPYPGGGAAVTLSAPIQGTYSASR